MAETRLPDVRCLLARLPEVGFEVKSKEFYLYACREEDGSRPTELAYRHVLNLGLT